MPTPIVLEIDKIRTTAGNLIDFSTMSSVSPPTTLTGEVLTYNGTSFVKDASFAQITYVNYKISELIDGASGTFDSLSKIETVVMANNSNLALVQSTVATKAESPVSDSNPDDILRYVSGTLVNDNTFAQKTYVDSAVSTVVNGAVSPYDNLLGIQTELQGNDVDIANLQTDVATKVEIPPIDTGASEVLAWRGNAWVNDPNFALISYVDAEILDVIGGATLNYDNLGKIEAVLLNVDSTITGIQSDIVINQGDISSNRTDINNEVNDRQTAISNLIDNATTPFSTLGKIENQITLTNSYIDTEIADLKTDILGGASPAFDTLLEIQNHIADNDSDIGSMLTSMASKAPKPPNGIQAGEFLRWDEINGVFTFDTPIGGALPPPTQTSANTFLYHDGSNWQYGTPSIASGAGSTVTGGIVQAVNNTSSGGEALSASGYSSKGFASLTTQLPNSMILFMTSGIPQANGTSKMYIHWRFRDNPSDPWSNYQDTGKVMMLISRSNYLSEPREGAISIHAPMRPAGSEVEYRVFFHVLAGVIYYPDNSISDQLTNMTLMEVAL